MYTVKLYKRFHQSHTLVSGVRFSLPYSTTVTQDSHAALHFTNCFLGEIFRTLNPFLLVMQCLWSHRLETRRYKWHVNRPTRMKSVRFAPQTRLCLPQLLWQMWLKLTLAWRLTAGFKILPTLFHFFQSSHIHNTFTTYNQSERNVRQIMFAFTGGSGPTAESGKDTGVRLERIITTWDDYEATQ